MAFIFGQSLVTVAQIVPDSTLPNPTVVTPEGNTRRIEAGTRRGNNLFHSFQQFSIPTGTTAFFNNAIEIQNIFSRVTGLSLSNIDGIIRANGNANLFLINPNGIIFGPNAALEIGGSFLGSTAEAINFADGSQFRATQSSQSPLLTVSVPIGLQMGRSPASIGNQSLAVNRNNTIVGLEVQPGKTLGLVGGNIIINGGRLTATEGRIE
ncbi:MAG: filamentous hemagglutinin N-terminal domain-containing protein, partial [Cyanobacteriota bacterium]|nr:filamentous hemagglutinin N-terminal domain-containing protein [Cyanobacteriota bacterium]